MTKFIYTGIFVSDLENSIRFYTQSLGMELLFRGSIKETGGMVAWVKSKGSKQILELNWYPNKYRFGGKSGLDHLAFSVKEIEISYNELTKKYRGAMPPFLEGRLKLAYIKDPDGNWIELGQKLTKRQLNAEEREQKNERR